MTDIRRTESEPAVTPTSDTMRASWTPIRWAHPRRLGFAAVIKDQGGGWLWKCAHDHGKVGEALNCGNAHIAEARADHQGER